MLPLPPSSSIIPCNLTLSTNNILINHQPLQPHRPPRMDLIRADADLSPEAKAHPVRHPGTRVPEHAGAVDAGLEAVREGRGGGKDGVGVVGGVGVYVGDGKVDGGGWVSGVGGGDGLDGKDEVKELSGEISGCGALEQGGLVFEERLREGGFGGFVAAEGDPFFEEGGSDSREDCCECSFVNEEAFDGVAGGWVTEFGV